MGGATKHISVNLKQISSTNEVESKKTDDKQTHDYVVEEKQPFDELSNLAIHYPDALAKRHFFMPDEAAVRLFNYLPRKNSLSLVDKSLNKLNKEVFFFPLLRMLPEVKQQTAKGILLSQVSEEMGIRNDAELACYLGKFLDPATTENKEGRFEEAFSMLEDLAHAGCAAAQYEIGLFLWKGGDYKSARVWFDKAAPNSSDACACIGGMIMNGDGTAQNFKIASEWLEKAIAMNPANARAYYYLGRIRSCCGRIPENYTIGEALYLRIQKDDEEAMRLYLKSAELGRVAALSAIGTAYMIAAMGHETPRTDEVHEWDPTGTVQAFHYYQQASNAGDKEANDNLELLSKRICNSYSRNSRHFQHGEFFLILGTIYINGWHVKQDILKALVFLASAVEKGYEKASITLNEVLDEFDSTMLLRAAEHLEKNEYSEAYAIYAPLAKAGNAEAKQTIALMFMGKLISDIDKELFVICFEHVANQGNGDAAFTLANWYVSGSYFERNPEAAMKWYREAYRLGVNQASFELGKLYMNNSRSKSDTLEAKKWFEIAVAQHIEGAQKKQDEVHQKLESWFLF